MKKMKKILAMLLAAVMVMGMAVTAFAAGEGTGQGGSTQNTNPSYTPKTDGVTGKKTDTGTITVSGFGSNNQFKAETTTTENGLRVIAYQIIKADYNNKANGVSDADALFSGYSPVYPNTLTKKDNGDFEIKDEATLANVLAAIKTANPQPGAEGTTAYEMHPVSNDPTSYQATVPVGTYLVEITGSESRVYSNVVVSVRYGLNDDQTGNIVEQYNVNIIEQGNAWIKVQNKPSFDKIITNSDLTVGEGQDAVANNKANTTNIGGTVEYQITADIPSFTGPYPVFKVSDTLTNLTYKAGTLKVYTRMKGAADEKTWHELNASRYTITAGTSEEARTDIDPALKSFTIDFVKTVNGKNVYGLSNLVNAEGSSVTDNELVIIYEATLDASAYLSGIANPNTAKLTYTSNSNVESNDSTNPPEEEESQTKTYTFDIDGTATGSKTSTIIGKVNGEVKTETNTDNNVTLAGAEFTLYTTKVENNLTVKDQVYDGFYRLATNQTDTYEKATNGIVTTNSATAGDGKVVNNISIKGLPVGTYILTETKAPEGFSLNTHEYVIEVDATVDKDGILTAWSVKIDNVETAKFKVNQGVSENVTIIPTGSIGTTIPSTGDGQSTDKVSIEDVINTVRIPNTRLAELPSTGGIGTTIFTIGGCAIMIVAAGLFFATRRKSGK